MWQWQQGNVTIDRLCFWIRWGRVVFREQHYISEYPSTNWSLTKNKEPKMTWIDIASIPYSPPPIHAVTQEEQCPLGCRATSFLNTRFIHTGSIPHYSSHQPLGSRPTVGFPGNGWIGTFVFWPFNQRYGEGVVRKNWRRAGCVLSWTRPFWSTAMHHWPQSTCGLGKNKHRMSLIKPGHIGGDVFL